MYLDKTIEELHILLVKKEVTPLELTLEAIERAKKDTNNAFETICEKEAIEFASKLIEPEENNIFWGIPYVAKDNFSTKGILTTASSKMLENYIPVFNATVIEKLQSSKAVLIAKTTMDELAIGATGSTGHLGKTYNPYDSTHKYIIGGSSCGSAASVSSCVVPFALASDTGDSVRKPASYSGLVGVKPTWGRISRYGLLPFASSLDHVGFFTRSIKDAAYALTLLSGRDDKDSTSSFIGNEEYEKYLTGEISNKKICVIQEILDDVKDKVILDTFYKLLEKAKEKGATIDFVHMNEKILKSITISYLLISCAEATSNDANLDGIKFGYRKGKETTYQEVMTSSRSDSFSFAIKRRFMVGTFCLYKENKEEMFFRAQRARRLIVNAFNDLFKEYDAIVLPSVSQVKKSFEMETSNSIYSEDNLAESYLCFANLGGFPSLSMPIGLDNKFPFGMSITTKAFDEKNLLNIAYAFENLTNLRNLSLEKVGK